MLVLLALLCASTVALPPGWYTYEKDSIPGYGFEASTPGNWTITAHGVNLDIQISTQPLTIQSPLLLWSNTNAFMAIQYSLSKLVKYVKMSSRLGCYSDLGGHHQVGTSLPSKVYLDCTKVGIPLRKCVQLIDPRNDLTKCKTFRVFLSLSVPAGILTISQISFGDKTSCQDRPVTRTTAGCDFENGDSGLRNNLCGLADWTIQETIPDSIRQNFFDFQKKANTCPKPLTSGYPLLMGKIFSIPCVYLSCIPCLQPSGFELVKRMYSRSAIQRTSSGRRRRQSSGHALFLDPAGAIGVVIGPGIVEVPSVQHNPANAFLTLQYDMIPGGLHMLTVVAICTSSPANDLVPLDALGLHFQIFHLDRQGREGTICLDIHSFVTAEECSTFAIRIEGLAIDTALSVDNIFFASTLELAGCIAVDNPL